MEIERRPTFQNGIEAVPCRTASPLQGNTRLGSLQTMV